MFVRSNSLSSLQKDSDLLLFLGHWYHFGYQ